MRLKAFLQEGIESSKNWKVISRLDPDGQDLAKQVLDGLKNFKITSESFEGLGEGDNFKNSSKIKYDFSDGLVNVALRIAVTHKEDSEDLELSFVVVTASVDDKLLLQTKDNKNSLTYFSLFKNSQNDTAEKLKVFNDAIENFNDWYFDLSGKYGKVKLFKTYNDIIVGTHDSKKPRFVAIAGDFQSTEEISSASASFEPRVL